MLESGNQTEKWAPVFVFERVLRMQTEKWLSMKDICKHLGVSRDTVIKWVNEKDMPGTHIGRLWKFDPDEVDEWMKAYRQKQHEEK